MKSTPAGVRANGLAAAIVILVILVALGPNLNYGASTRAGEGSILRQFNYIADFLLTAWAAGAFHRPARLLAIPLSLTVALAFCWVSLSWAIAPGIGMRRLILTSLVVWTVFLATRSAGFERTVRMVNYGMLAMLVANYLAVAVVPSLGVHQYSDVLDPALVGCWHGLIIEKNAAGAFCAFTILFFSLYGKGMHPLVRLAVLLGATYFLYKTKSKTSLGLVVLSLGAGLTYLLYNPRFRGLLLPGFIALGALIVLFGREQIRAALIPLGRPEALTGRGEIWRDLWAYSETHPWGAGYGSFFSVGFDSPIYRYGQGWVTTVPNAHNGYLNLIVQVGFAGTLLIVLMVFVWPMVRLLTSLAIDKRRGALLVALLVFCACHNVTEASILERDAIPQVFLMLAIALIGVATAQPSAFESAVRVPARRTRPRNSRPASPQLR